MKIEWYSNKESNGRIEPWNGSLTLVLRTTLQHTRLVVGGAPRDEHLSTHGLFLLFVARVFRGSIRFPQSPFQWPRSRTATLGNSFRGSYVGLTVPWAVSFSWSYDRPVTQSIATLLEDDPHLRSNGNLPFAKALSVSPHSGADGLVQGELPPFFCPECWPFSPALPVTLTHTLLPPLTADSWAGIGEDCRRRTTRRPLTLAGSPVLPPLRLTGGCCHAD